MRKQVISPRDDLDLKPYVDRRVALFGRLGFDGDSSQRSFLVHRVVDLNAPPEAETVGLSTDPIVSPREPTPAIRPDGEDQPAVQLVAFADDAPQDVIPEEVPAPLVEGEPSIILGPTNIPEDMILPPEEAIEYWDPALSAPPYAGPLYPLWFRGEYLLWWTKGLRLPPLVTTSPSGTPREQAGVLGEPGTTILYGDSLVNEGPHSGARFRGGFWFVPERQLGIEGEYFWLGEQSDAFLAESDGSEIIARPFFDILNGQETAELVSFPSVVRGSVSVDALTRLHSAGIWFRKHLCGTMCDGCADPCNPCCAPPSRRVDFVLGYRYMQLEDDLAIREDLVSLDAASSGSFEIEDTFATGNTFHGVELGIIHEGMRGPFFLELLGKIALGSNRQEAAISGFSTITEAGVPARFQGGLLAQRTNIGRYSRDAFAVMPQLGATLGWRITQRLSLTAGYTLIYLSNVVRAGDQIDLDVNPNLLPPEADPFSGALRPAFVFRESDFWAHGFSFGGDLRW